MRLAHRIENTSVRKSRVKKERANNPSYEDIIKELKIFLVDELGWIYQPDYNSVRFVGKDFFGVIDINKTFMSIAFSSSNFTCKIKNIETFMTRKSGTESWIHFDMRDGTDYTVAVRG